MIDLETISKFCNAMLSTGLQCPAPIVANTDKIQRFGLPEDKGTAPCWYILHILPNGIAYGAFGDWKRNISMTWCNRSIKNLSSEEKRLYDESQNKWKAEQESYRAKAVERINYIWQHSTEVTDHPYLIKKQIKAFGLRLYKGCLLIPLYNTDGKLQSLQFISSSGEKRFKSHACVKGGFFIIGKIEKCIYIVEGYATGSATHEATNQCVVIAFNAGNLLHVAKTFREKYPDKEIIICADNDAFTTGGNVGIQKATEAAKAVNAKLVIPQFKDVSTKPTDFNDLMILEGLNVVKNQIDNAQYPKENLEETVSRLAKLNPLEYDQARQKEAERLNVRIATLDQEVKKLQKPSGNCEDYFDELETEIEPHNGSVDGAKIAAEIFELLKAHAIISDAQAWAITLWIIGTYFFDEFILFPRLLVNSPEKRCGKTTLMQMLSYLVHKKLMTSNITASAIFRSIALWKPTLLIDEGDTFLKNNDELRGIINSGHSKDGAFVLRVEGDSKDRKPKRYSTWAPMIIAMIGNPPDTIMDRSIPITLKRKLPTDKVKKLKLGGFEQQKELRQRLKKFVIDNLEAVKIIKDFDIISDNDRAIDNWQPLFAIAEILGGNWFSQAKQAFHELNISNDDESLHVMLLMDIQFVFTSRNIDKIHSEELSQNLIALEDRPWAELDTGRPLTKNRLAKMLGHFGIKPKQIWINCSNKNGYELSFFSDAFIRYLPAPTAENSRTLEPLSDMSLSQIQNSRESSHLEFQNGTQPLSIGTSRVLELQDGSKAVDTDSNEHEVITL